jgi:hypothetical protein
VASEYNSIEPCIQIYRQLPYAGQFVKIFHYIVSLETKCRTSVPHTMGQKKAGIDGNFSENIFSSDRMRG